jgi:hypothetical protein
LSATPYYTSFRDVHRPGDRKKNRPGFFDLIFWTSAIATGGDTKHERTVYQ